jgi:phosphoglycolate phosphatase-like HAD superfamily hydrolase
MKTFCRGFGDVLREMDAALKGIRRRRTIRQGFGKENIYIIGDSIYDIECAKRIGVISIGVSTGFAEYELLERTGPDYLYRDLSQWETLIQVHSWK